MAVSYFFSFLWVVGTDQLRVYSVCVCVCVCAYVCVLGGSGDEFGPSFALAPSWAVYFWEDLARLHLPAVPPACVNQLFTE